jgi:hypothetical protein
VFVTGHVSVSYLLHRALGVPLRWAAAAAVLPDAVDKGLRLAGLAGSGRQAAHNVFALAATTAAVRLWRGRDAGAAWFAGYAAHLAGDVPFSWWMPWFYPFSFGAWHGSVPGVWAGMSAGEIVLDLAVTVGALALWWRRRPVTSEVRTDEPATT